MLPRWHILFGAVFTLLIWLAAPPISLLHLSLVFFSSFLIDFDHYVASILKTKKLRLKHSFDYHKKMQKVEQDEQRKGIKQRGDFHLFHTVEFHVAIAALSFVWFGFFYIFIGMAFHSLLDVFDLIRKDRFYRREFFLSRWIIKRF